MPLVQCPDCGQPVSTKAKACPHCGAPREPLAEPDAPVLAVSPSMFRAAPIPFVLCLLLTACYGLGLVIFLVWWLHCRSIQMTVTRQRVILRKGLIARFTNEVRIGDIRDLQVRQGAWDRIFGVGTLEISSAGQSDIEIEIAGVANPQAVADKIRERM